SYPWQPKNSSSVGFNFTGVEAGSRRRPVRKRSITSPRFSFSASIRGTGRSVFVITMMAFIKVGRSSSANRTYPPCDEEFARIRRSTSWLKNLSDFWRARLGLGASLRQILGYFFVAAEGPSNWWGKDVNPSFVQSL